MVSPGDKQLSPLLVGIAEKQAWAIRHREELGREVLPWLEANKTRVAGEYHEEAQIVAMRVVVPSPPLRWGVMAGNVIHQLRSILDHLVCRLVEANGGTPAEGPGGNQFPIYTNRVKNFDERTRRGALQGVRGSHRRVIEEMQPYHAGQGTKTLLGMLSDLDNADKHRVLNPAVHVPDPRFGWEAGEIIVQDVEIAPTQFIPGATMHHDAIIAWNPVTVTGPDPKIEVELRGSRYVGTAEGFGLTTLLDALGTTVTNIVDIFTPCLYDIEKPPAPRVPPKTVDLSPSYTGVPLLRPQ